MALRSEAAAELRICSASDPAIDQHRGFAERLEYIETRDPSKLILLEGGQPTWFVCKPLTAKARIFCESRADDVAQWFWAFRFGVHAIENLEGVPWAPDHIESGVEGSTILSDKSMELLVSLIGAGVVDEIGSVILTRAKLGRDQKKGYSLPRTYRGMT
jgi:hypothetical protein